MVGPSLERYPASPLRPPIGYVKPIGRCLRRNWSPQRSGFLPPGVRREPPGCHARWWFAGCRSSPSPWCLWKAGVAAAVRLRRAAATAGATALASGRPPTIPARQARRMLRGGGLPALSSNAREALRQGGACGRPLIASWTRVTCRRPSNLGCCYALSWSAFVAITRMSKVHMRSESGSLACGIVPGPWLPEWQTLMPRLERCEKRGPCPAGSVAGSRRRWLEGMRMPCGLSSRACTCDMALTRSSPQPQRPSIEVRAHRKARRTINHPPAAQLVASHFHLRTLGPPKPRHGATGSNGHHLPTPQQPRVP